MVPSRTYCSGSASSDMEPADASIVVNSMSIEFRGKGSVLRCFIFIMILQVYDGQDLVSPHANTGSAFPPGIER